MNIAIRNRHNPRTSRSAHVALAFTLLLATAACRQTQPPPAPAPPAEAVAAPPTADEAPAPLVEDLTLMSRPGRLTINGATTGRVFLDGTQVADAIPAPGLEVSPGRHNVQALINDGRELTPPAATLVREGASIILYVRPQNLDERPLEDLDRITFLEGTLAEHATGEASGSFAATVPYDGSGAPAAATDGSSAPAATTDGSGAIAGVADPADVPQTEGSGEGSGESAEWAELIVNSTPGGVLYVDGRRSPWRTPARIRLPVRRYSVQVLYDDGTLSRHLEPPIAAGGARQVDFSGSENLTIR